MIKTVVLSGAEQKVQFDGNSTYFWVQNLSDADVLVSLESDIADGADNVLTIPSGGAGYVRDDTGGVKNVYLLGTGKVQIYGTCNAFCPFKVASGGGDSGGAVDEQARADLEEFKTAVNAKLATNAPYKVLRGSGTASSGAATISFSSAFSTVPTVVCTPFVNDTTYAVDYSVFVSAASVTSFTVRFKKLDSSGNVSGQTSGSFRWIAMGT